MNQEQTIERIKETGTGTFAMHSQTGVMYASHHVFNDAAYNLRIATYDRKGSDGWIALDSEGTTALAEVFDDCPQFPGEVCQISKRNNAFTKWFDLFLEEKDLPFESFTVTADNGMEHIMDTDVIINAIMNCNDSEQKGIKDMIVRIDFANGNVNHYFKHLGKGLANNAS